MANSFAQKHTTIDSLKIELAKKQSDTIASRILNDLAYYYSYREIDSSFMYARQALKMSQKSNYPKGEAKANLNIGNAFMFINQYDSAKYYFNTAFKICDKNNVNKSSVYSSLGILYKNLGNYEKALYTYFEGVSYDEKTNNEYGKFVKLINIANVYSKIENLEKSLEYELKALELAKTTKNPNIIEIKGVLFNNVALSYMQLNDLDKAIVYIQQSLEINIKNQNTKEIARNYNNLGVLYQEKGNLNQAIDYLKKSLKIREELKDEDEQVETNMSLGTVYGKLKNHKLSEQHFSKALTIAQKINNKSLISEVYLAMSNNNEWQKNYSEALKNHKNHVRFKDSILLENNLKDISEIEIKYQTEKKDKELAEQRLTIEKKETELIKKKSQNTFMTALAALFLVTAIMGWFVYNQHQKRKNQEILTLKREQQVKTLEALIEGEENERFRIAKELHDGVNGDLSAIKYKLSSLMEMNNKVIKEAITMIDASCKQVRAISHDLVPPSLENFSLVEATQVYCNNINSSNPDIDIVFQHLGNDVELPKKSEINIFRIVQELVTNSLKHAKASTINVQISSHNNNIQVTVEDNGTGFDKDEVSTKGIGLKNVQSRVEYLNATMDLISNEKGTSYTIDIDKDQINED